MNNCIYTEKTHPLTGDLIWVCEYIPENISLVEKFIKENFHEGYTVTIGDTITKRKLEIVNPIEDIIDKITEIIGYISSTEHSFVVFVGINSKKKEYIVGMKFFLEIFDIPSVYKVENGELVPDPVLSKAAVIKYVTDNEKYFRAFGIKYIDDKLTTITTCNEKSFRATVVKYVDDKAIATATGTFTEVIDKLDITEIKEGIYYKLACYNDIPYDYINDICFGCSCKKRGGLEISEGIYCNAYLNNLFKIYLKGELYTGTFLHLIRWYFNFQEATQIAENSINFEEWVQSFFKDPWREVSNLNDFKQTSGLYALILDKYAKCYIGQAQDIRKRILEHWRNDKFTTKGIDLFRAKDTTRIYAISLPMEELDKNEYNYVGAIPSEYRLNYLQGGTIAFHESRNTSPLFNENKESLDDFSKREEIKSFLEKKNADIFEEKGI